MTDRGKVVLSIEKCHDSPENVTGYNGFSVSFTFDVDTGKFNCIGIWE